MLTNWCASHARTVRHCQRDKSENRKAKKKNICDATGLTLLQAEKFKFVHVECTNTVCQRTPFFRSLAKDNLADYSGRAPPTALCSFLFGFVFHEFTFFFSFVHFPVFRASFATQMTMDGTVMCSGSLLLLFLGQKRYKVLISAPKIDVLACIQPFSRANCGAFVVAVAHKWWAFALENRLTCDINKTAETMSSSGCFFYSIYTFSASVLVCQSVCPWNV